MKTEKGVEVPADFVAALKANPQALAVFEGMRSSCQRRYARWIAEAKRPRDKGAADK